MRIVAFVFFALITIFASAQDQLLTHSTDFARVDPARWVAEGWRVDNPDTTASVVKAEDSVALVVATPNTSMAWTLTTEPLWTDPFSTLALSYFVDGPVAEGGSAFIELFDGSTGPITPGATNTENPLASGGRLACGALTPGLHVELVDLSAVEKLDRVAEITITVRSGVGPVAVRLNQVAFLAKPVASLSMPEIHLGLDIRQPISTPLLLSPESVCSVDAMRTAYALPEPNAMTSTARIDGLPFTMNGCAAVTPLDGGGTLTLAAEGPGNTLGLLIATRLWGSDEGWYSEGPTKVRQHARGVQAFRVVLNYTDGSVEVAQPLAAGKSEAGLYTGLEAYRVKLDTGKTLKEITLVEEMSYGQVALLAATVVDERVPELSTTPVGPVATVAAPLSPAPEDLALEGSAFRLVLDRAGLVRSFQVGEARRELITAPFELVTVMAPAGAGYPLQFVDAVPIPERNGLTIRWNAGDGSRQLEIALEAREDGALVCTPTLVNLGVEVWTPWAIVPRMTIQLSRGGETEYILGARSALQDSAPIDTAEIYGGQFPLQFMDSYDGKQGGGLAYMVLDDTLTRKWFEFKKGEDGLTTMAVSYRNLSLAPGERRALPSTVLLPHESDWRGPFQQYKIWANQRFPRTRHNGMKDLFYCRRDYPLGGTTYLFDPAKKAYSFERLISESNWAFGGVDMVDISGWAYNEQIGRVGTYLKNDLGGLDGLAQGITIAHGRGSQVGLYFEGYLLDKRAANAERGLAEWQLIREGMKPAWWGGDMEFFCCPGAKGWQDALAGDIAEVARVTQADAVYVDQLGICGMDKECWSASHGHSVPSNPIAEEIALLKRVREELDKVRPECAIYIEHIPCDAMTPWIDGAFNMGMKHTRHALGPTKLPLHRYLFPDLPVFEMVAHGIRPIPAEEDDLKLTFFHGMGLWLKGKGASWYSQGFRQIAPKFHEVLTAYKDYFRSPDALPQVDTLIKGVYANKFSLGGKSVYTIYNANAETVRGPLVKVEGAVKGKSLLDITPFGVEFDGATAEITGSLPPQGVAAVLVEW